MFSKNNLKSTILQMCEQAAEAHKAKGAIHSSRRSRMSSDASQISKDSTVDAILTGSNSDLPAKVQPLVVFLIIYCVLSTHNWFFVYSCSSYMVIYFRIQVLLLHGSHHLRIVMVMIITIIRSKEWQKLWTWLETEIHGKMMCMILYLMPLSWCLRIGTGETHGSSILSMDRSSLFVEYFDV